MRPIKTILSIMLVLCPLSAVAWEPGCPLGSNPDASWILCLDAEEFDYAVTGITDNGSGAIRLEHSNNPVPNAWATSTTYPITGTVKAENGAVRLRSSANMQPQLTHNGFVAVVNVGGTVEANGRHRIAAILRKASADIAADTVTLDSEINGLQENDQVYINLGYNTDGDVVSSVAGPGLGNVYFVKGLTPNGRTFQISTSPGGVAANMTSTAGIVIVRAASLIDLPEVGYVNTYTSGGSISRRYVELKNSSLPYRYWPIASVDTTHVDLVGSTYAGQVPTGWKLSPCDSTGQSEECFLVTGGNNYVVSNTLYDESAFKVVPCKAAVGTHCFRGNPARGSSGSGYNAVGITPTTEIAMRYYEREIGKKSGKGSHGPAIVMNQGSIMAVEPQQTTWFMIYEASGQVSTALGGGQNWYPTVLQTSVPVVGAGKWHLYEVYAKMETSWTDGLDRTIASFSNQDGLIKVNFNDPHGHFNGSTITISGADASWGANGTWTIEQAGSATIDPGSLVLTGSTFASGSGATGTATLKDGKGQPGECNGALKVWIDSTLVADYPTMCWGRLNNVLPGYAGLEFATVWAPRRYEHRDTDSGTIEIDGVVVKTSDFVGAGPYIGASAIENSGNIGVAGHPFMIFNGGQENTACLIDTLNAPGGTSAYTGAMCKSGYSTSPNIGVSGLSAGSGGEILVTSTYEHGLWTGDQVFLSGAGLSGTGAAGTWVITRISDTTFQLVGSTYGTTNATSARYEQRVGTRKPFVDCSNSSSIFSKTGAAQLFNNLGWRNRPGTIDNTISAPGETISPLCGANRPSSSATTTSTVSGLQAGEATPGSYKLHVDGSLCTTANCGAGAFYGRDAGAYTASGTQNPGGMILTGCGGNNIKTCGPDYLHDTQVVNQWMLAPASLPSSTYSGCNATTKSCVAYSGFVGTTTTAYGNYLAITVTDNGRWGVVQRDGNDNARKAVYEGTIPVAFDKWDRVELIAFLGGADQDTFSLRVNGQLAINKQLLTYSIAQNGGTGRNWLYCSIAAGQTCSNPGAVEGIIEHLLGVGDVVVWVDQFMYANASLESCDGWTGDVAACPFTPVKTGKTIRRR